ncbi:MAG UNVERIFIED_CONTAM: hypothetical protein LVR18_36575 [Planctomycetaceae bacterium]|jgi:hypothetical protein
MTPIQQKRNRTLKLKRLNTSRLTVDRQLQKSRTHAATNGVHRSSPERTIAAAA